MSKYLLLTGCTGLVGRYLLRNLSLAGVPLAVVVRPGKRQSAEERVEQIMDGWNDGSGNPLRPPVCLAGDLTRPGLGLSGEQRRWVVQSCDRVLHNAASLTFEGQNRAGEPWLSNLTGTRHLLDFCSEGWVREFHHVSTAYVSGRRSGVVLETELEHDSGFRNDYEQSKLEAELLIRRADFLGTLTVYRPSVIVGDFRTGYTSTYHGLYRYFQLSDILHQQSEWDADKGWNRSVRLEMTGEERRNLVPVDWVAAIIDEVVRRPALHGRTYHLCPLSATRTREVEEALSDYFDYHGVEFVGPGGIGEESLNALESTLRDFTRIYHSYVCDEPIFDCSNTLAAFPDLPCPKVDSDCLLRLLDFAIRDRWGKRRAGQALEIS